MKFESLINENGHTKFAINNNTYYLNKVELQNILDGKPCYVNDGAIIQVDQFQMIFYPNIYVYYHYAPENIIKADTLVLRCNTQRMFKRIQEATTRLGVGKRITMDSKRFPLPDERPVTMSFAQILKHPAFEAKEALYAAISNPKAKPYILKLKETLALKLAYGFHIYNDWIGTPNFYFTQTRSDGSFSNGGIIFSENYGWSVHT